MALVDFRELKRLVTPYQYLRALGWFPRWRGATWCYGPCPVCARGGRRDLTLSVRLTGQGWHCHRCHKGGDVISLATHLTGLCYQDACAALCDQLGLALPVASRR